MDMLPHARKLTHDLRSSQAPHRVAERTFLEERGLDPNSCAVGGEFPEDLGEFTIIVDSLGNAYSFVLVNSAKGPILSDWEQLDEDGLVTYEDFVAPGRAVLGLPD